MTEQRRQLVDEVLDRFVYTPVGLAAAVARAIPHAAEEGRRVLRGPVQTAQFVSQMAVGVVRSRYGEQLRGVEERLSDVSERLSALRDVAQQVGAGVARSVFEATGRAKVHDESAQSASASARDATTASSAHDDGGSDGGVVGGIEAYATLSAAEVIERLDSLSDDDLHAVELFELEHRRRRTVLARIAKIREERGRSSADEGSPS